jgi:hypothetical protein
MTQPGYWKTREGVEMSITSMDDRHLHNSIKLCHRSHQDLINSAPWAKNQLAFFETKLIELGGEAQNRGWLPAGNLEFEEMLTLVAAWPGNSHRSTTPPKADQTAPITPKVRVERDISFTL